MILVTTAGKVGFEAVRVLAERGEPVRVLSRHPERQDELRGLGAEVVPGDLSERESIDAAMSGVSRVVLVSPAVPAQELDVIDSAVQAGVEHVIKVTSRASADSPIARQRGQAQIEAALVGSGLPHTLLRGNFYMQNLLMLAPEIAATGGFGASVSDGQVGLLDARDVAAVAAGLSSATAPPPAGVFELTGPELLTYAEVAAVLSRVLDRPVVFRPRSRAEDEAAMVAAGLPAEAAAMNAHALSLIADGDAAWLSRDVQKLLGRPPGSFAAFAAEHAAAFGAEVAA